MSNTKEWFGEWFDTSYYHTLYQHRDYTEAEFFIKKLVSYFNPSKESLIVDLACGKGRHSKYLNTLGYKVLGLDLSKNSIQTAAKDSNDQLTFGFHDMRDPLPVSKVDYVFNLFTSFGYFDEDNEDLKVLKSVYEGLDNGGNLVLDFMNVQKVISNLVPQETKELDGIQFEITRAVENNFIVKNIQVEDKGEKFNFQERVKVLNLEKFKAYFQSVGFELVDVFGNYDLDPFDEEASNRLILIAKK